MERLQRSKVSTIATGVLAVILGVIIFMNPQNSTMAITQVVGWVLVILGVSNLAGAFNHWSVILSSMDLYTGILALLMGILIISNPGFFVAWIFILLGIAIMVGGFRSLYAANALHVLGAPGAGSSMAGSVVAIVLGALVMLSPFSMANATMIICAVALVYAGAMEIVGGLKMDKDAK